MVIFFEIYQFLFISSIIFILHILIDLIVKVIVRFKQNNNEIVFTISNFKKILFWFSTAIILSFLI